MNDEADQTDDVVSVGPAGEHFRLRRLPRPTDTAAPANRRPGTGHRPPSRLLVGAGAIIAVLTAVVISQAVELSGHTARVRPAATIQQVNDGTEVHFPLTGTSGAILQALYLRSGHVPAFIWLTLTAAGLPPGWIYQARVGDCVRGRPKTLTGFSAIPDHQTGIWLLSVPMPGAPGTIGWITVTKTGEDPRPLGGIRGNFLYLGRTVAIAPGHPVCS
jgi:hypothetical protein